MALTPEQRQRLNELRAKRDAGFANSNTNQGFRKFESKVAQIQNPSRSQIFLSGLKERAVALKVGIQAINDRRKQKRIERMASKRDTGPSDSGQWARGTGSSPMSGIIKMQKEGTDWEAITWVSLAFCIWVFVDRPGDWLNSRLGGAMGGSYGGFDFLTTNVLNTDWIAVLLSVFFIGFLTVNLFIQIVRRDAGLIITLSVLFFLSMISKFSLGQSISLSFGLNYLVLIGILLLAIGLKNFSRLKDSAIEEFYIIVAALVYSYFLVNNGWMDSTNTFFGVSKPMIHFLFISLFGALFIRKKLKEEGGWAIITSVLLIIDFFGYSLLAGTDSIFNGIPILALFSIIFVANNTESFFPKLAIIVVAFIIVGNILFIPSAAQAQQTVTFQEADSAEQKGIVDTLSDKWNSLFGTGGFIQKQISYAVTGKVEEYEKEPVGVYIESFRPAEPNFYHDEDVIFWGLLKVRTLDDPVIINAGCYLREGTTKKPATLVDPNHPFIVYALEEKDFACTFGQSLLSTGTSTITAYTDFNFETEAKQKVYFIHQETLRSMLNPRVKIDPFADSRITDRTPVARYTNGPIKIEMGILSSYDQGTLVGVETEGRSSSLTITIRNNDGWKGELTKGELTELVILAPRGVTFEGGPGCTLNANYNQEWCESDTELFVGKKCKDACETDKNKEICSRLCQEKVTQGKEVCAELFTEENEDYKGYKVTLDTRERDNTEGIFKKLTCRFTATDEVLQGPKITTKFFKVKTRYDYRIEKQASVKIERFDETGKIISGPITVSKGSLPKTDADPETKKLFIERANFLATAEITESLLAAVAEKESNFRHCITGGTDECGTRNKDNVLKNGNNEDGYAWGMMQIHDKAHPDLFTAGSARLTTYGCNPVDTAYDFDCNIKAGKGILSDRTKYINDGDEYRKAVQNNCKDVQYLSKYLSYVGYERVLRAYNGFGCKPPGADVDYVEKVRDLVTKYNQLAESNTKP